MTTAATGDGESNRSGEAPALDKGFAGAIPEIYDQFLVPLIFQDYAEHVARRVQATEAGDVLETACGTGVVTRAMAARLPVSARIVATDLNQPMLDYARARQQDDGRLVWQQADASALPFGDDRFHAVVCQFGVMFFPDKARAYREVRRVLKTGGRFLFSVWDRIAENVFADTITEALATRFPDDPPRFLARTPHGYHDVERIRAELAGAGFADIAVEAVERVSAAPSPMHPAIAYCQGTPLRNEIEARDASGLGEATRHAADAIAARFEPGAVQGRIRGFVVTATA